MNSNLIMDQQYRAWLVELKHKVRNAQIRAAVKVNQELLRFYWELGTEIVAQQANSQWGDGFLQQLSHDLTVEFPEMKGFSKRNLELVRQWYLFYSQLNSSALENAPSIAKQVVSQLMIEEIEQELIALV